MRFVCIMSQQLLRLLRAGKVHSRYSIFQFSNISKQMPRMKVPLNIRLFKRHNLSAKQMLEIKTPPKILPQIYKRQ